MTNLEPRFLNLFNLIEFISLRLNLLNCCLSFIGNFVPDDHRVGLNVVFVFSKLFVVRSLIVDLNVVFVVSKLFVVSKVFVVRSLIVGLNVFFVVRKLFVASKLFVVSELFVVRSLIVGLNVVRKFFVLDGVVIFSVFVTSPYTSSEALSSLISANVIFVVSSEFLFFIVFKAIQNLGFILQNLSILVTCGKERR